ncbi:uncharacterized protein LOC135477181 [Liolophura sinensis]|uniref:uncharacterized protein LOC135477181 n=1 Tax=Liolophura sinensis TaxID=3198878 RepID=UPI0031587D7F
MKFFVLAVLVAVTASHVVVVESQRFHIQGCYFQEGGKFYPVGAAWDFNCQMHCTCERYSNGDVAMGCVSMCPPMGYGPGCREVYSPDRNPVTSENCCPQIVCD